ncbi:MAG: hypothetical protein LBP67_05190 [Bacteroidales bacterium]|jgi:hypothetical protein|nr:hypothetical protein [Bacteroidales bacterium]
MNYVCFPISKLQDILSAAAETAVSKYIAAANPKDDLVSERQAYRRFGEARIRRWAREGKLTYIRSGVEKNSKKLYSLAQLIALEQSEMIGSIIEIKTM